MLRRFRESRRTRLIPHPCFPLPRISSFFSAAGVAGPGTLLMVEPASWRPSSRSSWLS